MLYTYKNAHLCTVQVVGGDKLDGVMSVDTATGEVVQYILPTQIGPDGELATLTRRFKAAYPLGRDSLGRPCLLHLYEEIHDEPCIPAES